eukprot:5587219-Amphidinium_carterae.1
MPSACPCGPLGFGTRDSGVCRFRGCWGPYFWGGEWMLQALQMDDAALERSNLHAGSLHKLYSGGFRCHPRSEDLRSNLPTPPPPAAIQSEQK